MATTWGLAQRMAWRSTPWPSHHTKPTLYGEASVSPICPQHMVPVGRGLEVHGRDMGHHVSSEQHGAAVDLSEAGQNVEDREDDGRIGMASSTDALMVTQLHPSEMARQTASVLGCTPVSPDGPTRPASMQRG